MRRTECRHHQNHSETAICDLLTRCELVMATAMTKVKGHIRKTRRHRWATPTNNECDRLGRRVAMLHFQSVRRLSLEQQAT
jgi:hypothetical protein